MRKSFYAGSVAILIALGLAGCGGGGGGGSSTPVVPPSGSAVSQAISAAAAVASNDTATNSSASFTVLQSAGVAAVTVNSPPKVNFAVFSDGKVKSDLTISNVSFAIAKLVPGTNGNPDQWVNYVYRKETAVAPYLVNSVPTGTTATQATTDGKMSSTELAAAGLTAQLVYNADGYYTYTFKTDIKNPAWAASDGSTFVNGVTYEPTRTHRIAIQLSYTNAAGEAIKVNPYFDFTIGSDGKSIQVTDPSKTRKMADVSSCNGCHDKLGLHGGGRVDVQYCVMCHNPGTTDANSGNVLTMATMVHKIHAGKGLSSAPGGEDYVIYGYQNTKVDFAEVGFPQDLRNCSRCHSGSNPATPQGDNWKTKPTREACLTCHASKAGSSWYATHTVLNEGRDPNAPATLMPNSQCAGCHVPGTAVASERVHWNQNEENGAKYKMNIESASYDSSTRKITLKYFLSDPTNGNAAYNLITSDCAFTGTASACTAPSGVTNNTKFGNLRFYATYPTMIGQSTAVTEYTSYNNGGSNAYVWASAGTNDGSNHYTATITLPADSSVSVAFGTARVVSIGQVKEPTLQIKTISDPRPEVSPRTYVNVVVQNTFTELALTGTLNPRRTIVATEKCNVCHGSLGATSGSNTLAEAFHTSARNIVEACVVCHDPNRVSSTVMTNGQALNESYQFKRMIHGIHGNNRRTYPFTHGNVVQGIFDKTGKLTAQGTFFTDQKITGFTPVVVAAGTTVAASNTFATIADIINATAKTKGYTGTTVVSAAENYAAEVTWPGASVTDNVYSGVGVNCNACHVNNSYKQDLSPVPSAVYKPTGVTDPNGWTVMSPKVASCTACHDSPKAQGHVASYGGAGATYGNATGTQLRGLPREACDDCHLPGGVKGVDLVHNQK